MNDDREALQGYLRNSLIPSVAVDDIALSSTGLRVLVAMGSYASKRNEQWCWPSREDIAERLGITVRSVSRASAELEHLGYIEVQRPRRTDGTRERNFYRIDLNFTLPPERMHSANTAGGYATSPCQEDTGCHPVQEDTERHPDKLLNSTQGDTERHPVIRVTKNSTNRVTKNGKSRVTLDVTLIKENTETENTETENTEEVRESDHYYEVGSFVQIGAYLSSIGVITTRQREKLLRLSRLERHDTDRADYRLVCVDTAALQFATSLQTHMTEALRSIPHTAKDARITVVSGLPEPTTAKAAAQ